MRKLPRSPVRVVIVGTSPVAFGVCGLLLNAGYEPAFVMPVLLPTANANVRTNEQKMGRISQQGWPKDVICYSSLQDAFEALGVADWIFDASWFSLEDKQALFRYIDVARKPHCLVTTDESVATCEQLTEGFSQRLLRNFAITHFFLPPERLPLVEIVFGKLVSEDSKKFLTSICANNLGRHVLLAPDSPGFVANRIGMYWVSMAAIEAVRLNIDIQAADVAMREELGMPRSGVFGLIDLIGLDVFSRIVQSMQGDLELEDDIQNYQIQKSPFFMALVADKKLGSAGFYEYNEQGRATTFRDLLTGEYHLLTVTPTQEQKQDEELLSSVIDYKKIVRTNLASYINKFSQMSGLDTKQIHDAMQKGYGWKL